MEASQELQIDQEEAHGGMGLLLLKLVCIIMYNLLKLCYVYCLVRHELPF